MKITENSPYQRRWESWE